VRVCEHVHVCVMCVCVCVCLAWESHGSEVMCVWGSMEACVCVCVCVCVFGHSAMPESRWRCGVRVCASVKA
jgi:hypothetical protein